MRWYTAYPLLMLPSIALTLPSFSLLCLRSPSPYASFPCLYAASTSSHSHAAYPLSMLPSHSLPSHCLPFTLLTLSSSQPPSTTIQLSRDRGEEGVSKNVKNGQRKAKETIHNRLPLEPTTSRVTRGLEPRPNEWKCHHHHLLLLWERKPTKTKEVLVGKRNHIWFSEL